MPLEKFPLLQDNTRLIRFKDTLYKVKVKYKSDTFPGEVNVSQREAHDEIEQTYRAVLYLSERNQALKSIATPNFLIKPFKIPWSFPRKCRDYAFQQNGKTLKVFDYMFEFHVSCKDAFEDSSRNGKTACSADKRLDVYDEQSPKEKAKCKDAVVIVTDINDINSDGATRFGRRKDGQLYRVYTHNAETDERDSNDRVEKVAKENDQNGKRLRNPKVSRGDSRQSLEGDSEVEERDLRKNENKARLRNSERNESQRLITERHGQLRKQVVKKHSEKVGVENSNAQKKSNKARDKFSLSVVELGALKKENVKQQRLRSRKSSSERSLSHVLREHTKEINYMEQGTESECSQTEEEATDRENAEGNSILVADVKPRHETRKGLRKSKNERKQTEPSHGGRNRNRDGTIKSRRKQHSKVDQGKRLKNGRSLRSRYRHRHRRSRVLVDSSSQSETEIEESADDTDERNNYTKVGNDINTVNDSGHKKIRTRSSDRLQRSRNSQNKHTRGSSVESDINENAGRGVRRHSQRLASKNRDSSDDDFESDEIGNHKTKLGKSSQYSENKTKNTSVTIDDYKIESSLGKSRTASKKRKSETSGTDDSGSKDRGLHRSSQHPEARQDSHDSGLRHSPRKTSRPNKKRKVQTDDWESNEETHSVTTSQDSSRSRKVKLYASRHSPQVVGASKPTTEISSPLVSAVLPLKRNQTGSNSQLGQRSVPAVTSPRLTRQSLQDDEARRIASLREERPTQIYRDIMLAQGRDRHLVEQAENAETDKLLQLYEPTVPRRSPRLTGMQGGKKRRSSGLWGKIMETLVTPTKKYMFGNRK